MLDNLTQRLSRVVKTMRGEARLTEANTQDMLREVRMALLEADVPLPVVRDFVARVKERALGREVVGSLTPGQARDRKSVEPGKSGSVRVILGRRRFIKLTKPYHTP